MDAQDKAVPLEAIRQFFEFSVYLMLATGFVALALTGKLDWVSVGAGGTVLLYRGLRYVRASAPDLPLGLANRLTILYMLFFPFDLFFLSRALAEGSSNPMLFAALMATIHLLIFSLGLRLLSAQTQRDYLFLVLLAFGEILAAAILTVETHFLVVFGFFLLAGIATFLSLEIQRSSAGAVSVPLARGTPASIQVSRALLATSLVVAGGVLAVGSLLFFILPRYAGGYLSGLNLQPTLIHGFSDNVSLGDIGRIKLSRAVVMRVQVRGDPWQVQGVKWRGIALTEFDGHRWSSQQNHPRPFRSDSNGWFSLPLPSELHPAGTLPVTYRVILEPVATDAVFVAAEVAQVRGGFREPGSRTRGYLVLDSTRSLLNPFHNFARVGYEAVSFLPRVAPETLRSSSPVYPREVRAKYLQLPPQDPRLPQLAREVTRSATNTYDKASMLELFLRTKFGYTLDLPDTPQADPLAHFLFERKKGHCEYFASSMAVMLRTLGIPSRLANGFLTGEYNDVGNDYIVRARDAHSWVEVYFPGYGWYPFDPTPPDNESQRTGLWARVNQYLDALEWTWTEWVINYDFTHQVSLARNLERSSRSWVGEARHAVKRARRAVIDTMKRLQDRMAHSAWSLALALLLGGVALLLLRGRAVFDWLEETLALRVRASPRFASHQASISYQRMLRLLGRRGLVKRPWETPEEFAHSVSRPELLLPVRELTELYNGARFGTLPLDTSRFVALLNLIKTLPENY